MSTEKEDARLVRAQRILVFSQIIFFVVTGVLFQVSNDLREKGDTVASEKDIAQRYQRCKQVASGATGSNTLRVVTQRVASALEDFTGAVENTSQSAEVRRTARALSLEAIKAVALQVEQPVADCEATYPDGRKFSARYGDRLAPTLNTTP